MEVKKEHIREEWNEGHPDDGGDGYWIALKSGWRWDGDPVGAVHSIHEDTRRAAHQQGVLPCGCADCQNP
jgi:hypothetical protein